MRIIDANLNRIGEGLRFLEEVARLLLNDTVLSGQLKTMRHELIRSSMASQQQFLQARDAGGDVGADIEVTGEEEERELPMALIANARRVQESLRTLEELAKVPGTLPELDAAKFKKARFDLYTIERELLAKLLSQDKVKQITGLCVVLDTQVLEERTHLDVARQVVRGGAGAIQLRDKVKSKKELLPLAHQLKVLCAEHGVLFIVNDHLDIALDSDADGLHVGQDDLPVQVARKYLPLGKVLGCSANSVEEAGAAQSGGADYIGVGPIYPTDTKDAAVVGLDRLQDIRKATTLPIVAIGGINKDNVSQVLAAGADSVAVISAILTAESPEEATRQILERMAAGSE
ncbi:MAG: thiamine phosphate synthase [Dehalococcoidales bacterium]|nr:MAG: thiamine phosphate synthase [Dehalococcoidales bacterium]